MNEKTIQDRRQHGWYAQFEDQLEEHTKTIETRLSKFIARALFGFAGIGVACAVSLVGFGLVLNDHSNISKEIQTQRYNATLDTCRSQNERHDNVLREIDKAVAQVPKGPKRVKAEKGAVPFKLIITAAVPYTPDCAAFARTRVKDTGQ